MSKRHDIKRGKIDGFSPLENERAEGALLGMLLANDSLWFDISDRIAPEDFAAPRHRMIYRGMQALREKARAIQPVILLSQIAELNDQGVDETLEHYVETLAARVPQKSNINELADVVLHASGRRKLKAAGERIIDMAMMTPLDASVEDVRGEALALVESTSTATADDAVPIFNLVADVILNGEEVRKGNKQPGVITDFKPFDEIVGTMLDGQVIVLGGETGSGKTALAMRLAWGIARQSIPVHVTSLEMSGQELGARLLSKYADLQAQDIIDPRELDDIDWGRVAKRAEGIRDLPIYIEERPNPTVPTIQARLARAKIQNGIRVAVIDHLQFVQPTDGRTGEHQQIRQCVDDIKAMAKRLKIIVILLSHVTRTTEPTIVRGYADILRPRLRDLYGSSAIEKAADAVVFVHRPIWFLERGTAGGKDPGQLEIDKMAWAGKAELILPKRRGGKGYATSICEFEEELTWFKDSAR